MTHSILISDLQKAPSLSSQLGDISKWATKLGMTVDNSGNVLPNEELFSPIGITNAAIKRVRLAGGLKSFTPEQEQELFQRTNKLAAQHVIDNALGILSMATVAMRTTHGISSAGAGPASPNVGLNAIGGALRLAKRVIPNTTDNWMYI